MNEIPEELLPGPVDMIAATVARLGGVTLEVRARFHPGATEPYGVRVVVSVPDMTAKLILTIVVEALDGCPEGLPAHLAGGVPLPDLPCLAFWVPDIGQWPMLP